MSVFLENAYCNVFVNINYFVNLLTNSRVGSELAIFNLLSNICNVSSIFHEVVLGQKNIENNKFSFFVHDCKNTIYYTSILNKTNKVQFI